VKRLSASKTTLKSGSENNLKIFLFSIDGERIFATISYMKYELNQTVKVENQTAIVTGFVPDDNNALMVRIPATGEAFEVDKTLVAPIAASNSMLDKQNDMHRLATVYAWE